MSTLAVAWALKATGITPTQKLVLIHLADHHNEEHGFAWMGQTRLADVTGLTRETINRTLQALETDGWLTSIEQPRLDSGRATTKHYVLRFDRAPVVIGGRQVGKPPSSHVTQDHTVHVTQDHRNLEPPNLEQSKALQPSSAKPTRENGQLAPAQSTLLVRHDPQEQQQIHQTFLNIWNAHCGALPNARAITGARRRKFAKLHRELGGEWVKIFRAAVQQVASDSFWVEKGYGLDNLLVDGRVVEKAEKRVASGGLSAGDRKLASTASVIADAIGGVK
jgi:hypothetical protein